MTEKVLKHNLLIKKLPKEALIIFDIFGDSIRIVGGAVRDLLIDNQTHDFDFATILKPAEVKKKLSENNIKFVDLAEKFCTIIAVINNKNFEITTLRKDFSYDGRYCQVEYTNKFDEDALRRDFTINSLYLDKLGNIYDYCGGIEDIKQQKVKFIGDSRQRIKEDHLRILRFIRFSCQFAKEFDEDGLRSCVKFKNKLNSLSANRIRQEFVKILELKNHQNIISALKIINDYEFDKIIFNQKLNIDNFYEMSILAEKLNISISNNFKLALILVNKNLDLDDLARKICLTRSEKSYLEYFFKNLKFKIDSKEEIIDFLIKTKTEILIDYYLFRKIFDKKTINLSKVKENLEFLNKTMLAIFPINGNDLLKLGYNNKEIGNIITECKKKWLISNCQLTKKELLLNLNKI